MSIVFEFKRRSRFEISKNIFKDNFVIYVTYVLVSSALSFIFRGNQTEKGKKINKTFLRNKST